MAMEPDPTEEDDDSDDDQQSTAANPYGALKARYDSLLEKALRIQNFMDDLASQLERVQVCIRIQGCRLIWDGLGHDMWLCFWRGVRLGLSCDNARTLAGVGGSHCCVLSAGVAHLAGPNGHEDSDGWLRRRRYGGGTSRPANVPLCLPLVPGAFWSRSTAAH